MAEGRHIGNTALAADCRICAKFLPRCILQPQWQPGVKNIKFWN